jgi:hypothetical protein
MYDWPPGTCGAEMHVPGRVKRLSGADKIAPLPGSKIASVKKTIEDG